MKNLIKALFNIAVTNKKDEKDTWYFDIAIAIYKMPNLNPYIMLNLDNQTVDIEIAGGTVLRT